MSQRHGSQADRRSLPGTPRAVELLSSSAVMPVGGGRTSRADNADCVNAPPSAHAAAVAPPSFPHRRSRSGSPLRKPMFRQPAADAHRIPMPSVVVPSASDGLPDADSYRDSVMHVASRLAAWLKASESLWHGIQRATEKRSRWRRAPRSTSPHEPPVEAPVSVVYPTVASCLVQTALWDVQSIVDVLLLHPPEDVHRPFSSHDDASRSSHSVPSARGRGDADAAFHALIGCLRDFASDLVDATGAPPCRRERAGDDAPSRAPARRHPHATSSESLPQMTLETYMTGEHARRTQQAFSPQQHVPVAMMVASRTGSLPDGGRCLDGQQSALMARRSSEELFTFPGGSPVKAPPVLRLRESPSAASVTTKEANSAPVRSDKQQRNAAGSRGAAVGTSSVAITVSQPWQGASRPPDGPPQPAVSYDDDDDGDEYAAPPPLHGTAPPPPSSVGGLHNQQRMPAPFSADAATTAPRRLPFGDPATSRPRPLFPPDDPSAGAIEVIG